MKTIYFVMLAILMASAGAFAQQDPDDPGIQDSIIIETVSVDSPMRSVTVNIAVVSDDPVSFYWLPLTWTSLNDSIYPSDVIYYNRIMGWEYYGDTISVADRFIGMIGSTDTAWLNTGGVRENIWGLHFQITGFGPQVIPIDSTSDPRLGHVVFGLQDGITEITPAIVSGSIIYSPYTGVHDDEPIPQGIALLQNYPNPFNAQTTISYSLPRTGPVTLSIYNLLGQKVATLVDGFEQAGEHRVVWNAGAMPSGVYFGRLGMDENTEILKMLLIK